MLSLDYSKACLLELLMERSVRFGEFKLASGKETDFYIDCRKSTMDVFGRYLIKEICKELIFDCTRIFGTPKCVGGLTMGADVLSFIVGDVLDIGCFSVRKEKKKYGTSSLIEGVLEGESLIVDDVITSGGSIEKAICAVQQEGSKVKFIFTLVDRQEGGREYIEGKYNIPVFSVFKKSDFCHKNDHHK